MYDRTMVISILARPANLTLLIIRFEALGAADAQQDATGSMEMRQ